jgi:hypothetical protein
MLWILTAGWPFYYGCVVGISLGIMWISKQGPLSLHWPAFIRQYIPSPIWWMLDRFYAAIGPTALIVFPFFAMGMGAIILYMELAGQAISTSP